MSPGPARCHSPARARQGVAVRPPPRRRSELGNQARLARLRGARPRCGGDGDCKADEGRKRDPSGIATCNPTSGVVETTVFKEQCIGDCIAQHEATHKKDYSFCCEAYADCMKKAANVEQRNACLQHWLDYDQHNEAFTECNAYTVEQECMANLIAQNCGKGGKADKECCDSLRKEKEVVDQRQKAYCGGPNGPPVPMPCGIYFKLPDKPAKPIDNS